MIEGSKPIKFIAYLNSDNSNLYLKKDKNIAADVSVNVNIKE